MNIIAPSIPKRLAITPTMLDDFIWDPVLAAKFFLGFGFDIFQRVRLKTFWHVPFGIDSSGFSSGKTITDWAYMNLRCLLIPEHDGGVYYPVFQTGKDTFWPYYSKCRSPIFHAHLGALDERGEEEGQAKSKGPACYVANFRNGSTLKMPAPSMMKDANTQASLRFNTMLFEEWTHTDNMGDAINKQLLQRNTKPTFYNQHHPLWTNHTKFTAPAKTMMHRGFERVEKVEQEIRKGSPRHFHIRFCYKDYSPNVIGPDGRSFKEIGRLEEAIKNSRLMNPGSDWMGEGLGIWAKSGKGWYTEADIFRCCELGALRNVRPLSSRKQDPSDSDNIYYFSGTDPAPAQAARNDDGATAVLRARPIMEGESFSDNPADYDLSWVYLKRIRNASVEQYSGLLHDLHRRFAFSKMMLEWGAAGGGPFIKKALAADKQKINNSPVECTPIVEVGEAVVRGSFILHVFKRKDPGLERVFGEMAGDDVLADNAHTEMRTAVSNGLIAWPKRYIEWTQPELMNLGEENLWTLRMLSDPRLNCATEQFCNIAVAMKENGQEFALTRNGARQFAALKGRKDFVTAMMMAYLAFLIWLRFDGGHAGKRKKKDAVGFGGFS